PPIRVGSPLLRATIAILAVLTLVSVLASRLIFISMFANRTPRLMWWYSAVLLPHMIVYLSALLHLIPAPRLALQAMILAVALPAVSVAILGLNLIRTQLVRFGVSISPIYQAYSFCSLATSLYVLVLLVLAGSSLWQVLESSRRNAPPP